MIEAHLSTSTEDIIRSNDQRSSCSWLVHHVVSVSIGGSASKSHHGRGVKSGTVGERVHVEADKVLGVVL